MTDEEIEKGLKDFSDKLINNQQDLPPEFKKVWHDNFWDLIEESNKDDL